MTHQFTLATSGDTILITVTDPAGNEYVQRLTLDDARRLWMGLRHVTGGIALKHALIAEMRGTPYTMPETLEGAVAAADTACAPDEPDADEADTRQMTPITGYEGDAE